MKTFPILVAEKRARLKLAHIASWAASPARFAGWIVGLIIGSFVAGLMNAWEDVR